MGGDGGRIDPAEHLGLAHWGARRFVDRLRVAGFEPGEAEEWVGEAYAALCDAARTYDPAKAKWSTHASSTMYWKLRDEWERRRGHQRASNSGWRKIRAVSLGAFEEAPFGGEDPALAEADERMDAGALLERAMAGLSERERLVLERRAAGQSMELISAVDGCTRERTRQIELAALAKCRAALGVKGTALSMAQALGRKAPANRASARAARAGAGQDGRGDVPEPGRGGARRGGQERAEPADHAARLQRGVGVLEA